MSTAAASSAHLEFDTAASALQAAVVAALTDAAAHEALVVAVLETGTDTDGAAAILRRSIELAPANGGTKCPYLAQLVQEDPAEALRLTRARRWRRRRRRGRGVFGCGWGPWRGGGFASLPPPLGPAHPDRPDALR